MKKIGLALGGGAVLGAAHIGVIRALEEMDVEISFVTCHKPDSILDVIINNFHFTLKAASKFQTVDADLLITPDLSKFNMVSTDQIKDLIEQGYKDAKEQLKKADLS